MKNELPSAAAPAEKVVPALADISLAFSNASPVCAATDSAGGRPFRKVLVVVAYNPTNVTLTVVVGGWAVGQSKVLHLDSGIFP